MGSTFVHLHLHSEYSVLDSTCKIPALVRRAVEQEMPALALTDHGSMGGVIRFYREAQRHGIQPIIGCEVYVAPGSRHDRTPRAQGPRFHHLVLLAASEVGYRNLLTIVTRAHVEGFYYRPRADKELLKDHNEGLIALSACQSGEVPRLLLAGDRRGAARVASEYAKLFDNGRYYLEVQDHGTDRDRRLREELPRLATELGLPLVATNDIHYLDADDHEAHEVLLNIRANKKLDDPDRMRFDGEGFHFRTAEEMNALFADLPEALENTAVIAARCRLDLSFDRLLMPPFSLPETAPNPDAFLRELALSGAKWRFGEPSAAVLERIDYELGVIAQMSYSTYFLIVWDFVRFAREKKIPVGPGRGSAAGSMVAFCLGITSVDPLRYNVTFERFLNPDRVSMPDVDIDFCVRGRDRVIDYVREKYGGTGWSTKTSQIATHDRMAARSVIRDVCRVLGTPYATTDHLAKLVPQGFNLRVAVTKVPELAHLYREDPVVRRIVDIGVRLEGLIRNCSTHAAGVVISPDPLTEHAPLMRLTDGEIVTQFDMTDLETVGLLKFDFLGLRNLTIVDETCRAVAQASGTPLDIADVPLDDEKTFALVCSGCTAGIFQLEGSGMTTLIRRVRPNRFEDLIALLALYRPGPLDSGMTEEYVRRRVGQASVSYPHPSLAEILEETYGLPIYQDQQMLVAQRLAGFTLAEADLLRKAMGKKDKKIMSGLRERFLQGCVANGLSTEAARQTFEDMEKFSRYGFTKSHTTAYAFVSYWTAYLKAHHPAHFMSRLLASVQGDTDKIAEYIADCRGIDIRVLPPDINESAHDFTAVGDDTVRFGLGPIKHVSAAAVRAILAARETGPFESLFDLCRRATDDGVDRESLESLIKAGAFDALGQPRRGLLLRLTDAMEILQIARHQRLSGQRSFFDTGTAAPPEPTIEATEFDKDDLLTFERELLGLYVSAHPLDAHRDRIAKHCTPIHGLASLPPRTRATIGGRIAAVRRVLTKKEEQMAFVSIEDGATEIEVTVFPSVLATAASLVHEDALVAVTLTTERRNGEPSYLAERIIALEDVATCDYEAIALPLMATDLTASRIAHLRRILTEHPGSTPLTFRIRQNGHSVDVTAGSRFQVSPSRELIGKTRAFLGDERLLFRRRNP